jgi:hypothetical protein
MGTGRNVAGHGTPFTHSGVQCLRAGRLLVVGLPLDRCAEFAEGRPDRPQQRRTRLRRILAHLRVVYGVLEGPSRILDRLAHPDQTVTRPLWSGARTGGSWLADRKKVEPGGLFEVGDRVHHRRDLGQ